MSTGDIRAVIVDDDELTRHALRSILTGESGIRIVGEAGDGQAALEICRELNPDLVLMDVRMPGVDGLQATEELSRRGFLGRILILTTFESDDYVLDALRAGASGFCVKRAAPDDLVNAIRIVAKGDSLVFPTKTRAMMKQLVAPPRQQDALRQRLVANLTQREVEVLRCLAQGLANVEISAELHIGLETVKTHVSNVLAKTGSRDRVQAVILAYESGFVSTKI